jgi:hypothetical protein
MRCVAYLLDGEDLLACRDKLGQVGREAHQKKFVPTTIPRLMPGAHIAPGMRGRWIPGAWPEGTG